MVIQGREGLGTQRRNEDGVVKGTARGHGRWSEALGSGRCKAAKTGARKRGRGCESSRTLGGGGLGGGGGTQWDAAVNPKMGKAQPKYNLNTRWRSAVGTVRS